MRLIGRHPFISLIVAACLCLTLVVLFADLRAQGGASSGPFISIPTEGTLISPGISSVAAPRGETPVGSAPTSPQAVQVVYFNTGAPQASTSQAIAGQEAVGASARAATAQPTTNELLQQAYALIPSSFAPTQQTPKPRTSSQQALYDWGNEAGLVILTFDNANPNMAQVLQNWLNDRTNIGLSAQVHALASSLTDAGTQLASLPNVPTGASAANSALAQSFQDAGAHLEAVIAAGGSDTTLVDAMKTYDDVAEGYIRNFLAISDLLSLAGVSFGAGDTGSVFQFSSAGSL